jgi:demethylmenaquinone methyltransferase/2-methoxy-6-polyprenyl-1,4-benzoquinol methylase
VCHAIQEGVITMHMHNTSQENRDIFIKSIFASIAPNIDFLSSFFSFGLDEGWRKQLVSRMALSGRESVLDVCSGTGKLALLIAEKVCRGGSVIGVDFSEEMLDEAKKKISQGPSHISFAVSDAKNLIFQDTTFDYVTVSFGMRNIIDTAAALKEAYRVLKPGGRFYCLELTSPGSRWVQPLYTLYCFRIMPFIARKVLKTDVPYNYLPRSIKAFPSSGGFKGILEACGFAEVNVHPMSLGIATIYEAVKH